MRCRTCFGFVSNCALKTGLSWKEVVCSALGATISLVLVFLYIYVVLGFSNSWKYPYAPQEVRSVVVRHVELNQQHAVFEDMVLSTGLKWIKNLNQVPKKNMLIVHFLSSPKFKYMHEFENRRTTYFYKEQSSKAIMYAFPHTIFQPLVRAVIGNDNFSVDFGELNYQFSGGAGFGPLLAWKSKSRNSTVYFQPLIVQLPRKVLSNTEFPHCVGKDWSPAYALYSGMVFTYNILQLPLLSRFKYFVKVDMDIKFLRPMLDLSVDLVKRKCVVAHTQLSPNECEVGALKTLRTYVKNNPELGPARSASQPWCKREELENMFYGNFVAYSTELVLSERVAKLSRALFHNYSIAYFNRWGDQAQIMLYLCYEYNIPDIKHDPLICNYENTRGLTRSFIHAG
eukprot:CAMPEP_0203758802 /NCGR_PEP_ID=MMETSP0098-20131031/11648_1 /ASSEMBLY_ACC=CAM_ASM_000208 /TAXON_ID=96639 /ORGANISM=" , Strain NY0313808BC1" /LENGTH=397 /DNA_ID=CAMNT_0050651407 /DNA_START=107 /DNA_END=1300 /DNA_ORIENTATION=-